jgi:hypothetical protein
MIPAPGQKTTSSAERAPLDGGPGLHRIKKRGSGQAVFAAGDGEKADRRLQTKSGP